MITVELLDRMFKYDSSEQGAEEIIICIKSMVSESGLIIDYMDIDGVKTYLEHDKYIRENIKNIQYICVNLITKDEFITEILHSTYSYIQGALPRLQLIINSFYTGEREAEYIDDLANLLEGITWIFSVGREIIDKHYDSTCLKSILNMGYSQDIERLEEAFSELKNGIANMDYILIADIMNYEVLDVFNKIITSIQKLKSNKESIGDMFRQH